jgi:hypothetical protein
MLPDDFFKKILEMWEQFTSTYMETKINTAEKTMEQTKSFKDQIDKKVTDANPTQMDVMSRTR